MEIYYATPADSDMNSGRHAHGSVAIIGQQLNRERAISHHRYQYFGSVAVPTVPTHTGEPKPPMRQTNPCHLQKMLSYVEKISSSAISRFTITNCTAQTPPVRWCKNK